VLNDRVVTKLSFIHSVVAGSAAHGQVPRLSKRKVRARKRFVRRAARQLK
jgi:hypothetical protein